MKCTSIRLRPFNVGGCFEIVLPNGKVILLDPFFPADQFPGGQTREDVTGADYILLTHTHYDHDMDVGYFVKKFDSKVFCGAMSAPALMHYHAIPYDNLFPVYPGQRYTLEDFTVEFFQAKHNASGGRIYSPDDDIGAKYMTGHQACDMWGSMESLDHLITTNNGFRILTASGRTLFGEAFTRRPNLLLRQCGVRLGPKPSPDSEQVPARMLAELMVRYGAQVIFPFHQEVTARRWGADKTRAYLDDVAREVRALDPGALFVNPTAWRWYDIGMDVSAE